MKKAEEMKMQQNQIIFFIVQQTWSTRSVVYAWNTLASFFPVPPMLVTFISGTKWELSRRLKDSYHAKFSEAQILSASV